MEIVLIVALPLISFSPWRFFIRKSQTRGATLIELLVLSVGNHLHFPENFKNFGVGLLGINT